MSLSDLDMSGLQYNDQAQHAYSSQSQPHQSYNDSRRAASPALEHDEREFTQTASVMATRAQSSQVATPDGSAPNDAEPPLEPFPSIDANDAQSPEHIVEDVVEETDEILAQKNHEAAAALFGQSSGNGRLGGMLPSESNGFSSPLLRPRTGKEGLVVDTSSGGSSKRSGGDDNGYTVSDLGIWEDLKSPETVGLKELDDLLCDF